MSTLRNFSDCRDVMCLASYLYIFENKSLESRVKKIVDGFSS